MSQEPEVRDGRPGDVEAMGWARSEGQRDEWRHHLARGQSGEVDFLVIEVDGRVVGKAVLDWTRNADGTPWLCLGSVDPEYRSRGLGALGLAEAERRARDRGHVTIEMSVDDDNPRARDLYLRSGYSVVGPYMDEHEETLPDGTTVRVVSPGVLLRKRLGPGLTPWRLVVADLDGTLIAGTSAALHLDDWIGHGRVVVDLERRFVSGEMTNTEVAERYAPFYRDVALTAATSAMAHVPSLEDIALGVSLLSDRGIETFIVTAGWSFAAQALADLWGFTGVCGVDLEVDDSTGLFTGRVLRHFEPEDKVTFVAERCQRHGISLDQVVALGDGQSDLPLFDAVGFSVAINASPEAQAVASVSVNSHSLLDALAAVPGLLNQPTR